MRISFANNGGWREKMRRAFMLRFGAKADFIQEEDAVADPVNDNFIGNYAYVGALTHDTFEDGVEIGLHCSFEGTGAPMLMLTEDVELDRDGDAHYGACIEVILWHRGINVWRYTRGNGTVSYYLAMGAFFPLEEGKIHDLRIKVDGKWLLIQVDGRRFSLYIPDMPEKFWVGAAVCEGENRLYDLEINEGSSFDGFITWKGKTVPIQKIER